MRPQSEATRSLEGEPDRVRTRLLPVVCLQGHGHRALRSPLMEGTAGLAGKRSRKPWRGAEPWAFDSSTFLQGPVAQR